MKTKIKNKIMLINLISVGDPSLLTVGSSQNCSLTVESDYVDAGLTITITLYNILNKSSIMTIL